MWMFSTQNPVGDRPIRWIEIPDHAVGPGQLAHVDGLDVFAHSGDNDLGFGQSGAYQEQQAANREQETHVDSPFEMWIERIWGGECRYERPFPTGMRNGDSERQASIAVRTGGP